jgi:hypothetical protein
VTACIEELVGKSDAHEVLERLVSRSHRREGAVYGALVALEGDEAEVQLRLAAWDHGVESGRRAASEQEGAALGPSGVFDLVGERHLEGMPCRGTTTLLSEQPTRLTWKHDRCPFQQDWHAVGVPHSSACNVISAWLRGFAAGADERVEYRRPRALSAGDARCEHELVVIDGSR